MSEQIRNDLKRLRGDIRKQQRKLHKLQDHVESFKAKAGAQAKRLKPPL